MKKTALRVKSCISIFILLFLSSFCKSDDQLTQEKTLSSGDTLISKGGHFALGFFSSLYLGIWCHNIPSSPMLVITNSSDLVLSDSQGHTPWATKNNITGRGMAVLLDTGNLVLQFPNGTIIWQSFHHPADTILLGTRIFLREKARVSGHLIAWKSPIDPSIAHFSLSLDFRSNLQLVIWHGTMAYARLNMLNGASVRIVSKEYRSSIMKA